MENLRSRKCGSCNQTGASLNAGSQFGKMLRSPNQPIPVLANVFRRAADLGHDLCDLFGRHHFDRIPRANCQLVGIRFLLRDVYADFASDAALEVDFTPGLVAFDAVATLVKHDAVNGANFQARLATRAVICIDDCELFGDFFSWTLFGHSSAPEVSSGLA